MKSDISNYRKSYLKGFLSKNQIFDNPLKLFNKWFDEISDTTLEIEINAMTLSTIDNDGFPRNRVVLLKYFSDEEILIIGQKSQEEQMQAFSFASNYCNKNADAPN